MRMTANTTKTGMEARTCRSLLWGKGREAGIRQDNRRKRLTTRSSGKQPAERTAVRAAPIVCPEESIRSFPKKWWNSRRLRSEGDWGRAESPQCARRRTALGPEGHDAPTTAREQGLQPYGGVYLLRQTNRRGAGGTESPCMHRHTPTLS